MLTTGEVLRKERIRRQLTLEQIEKITRIRKKNLQAIESGDWKKFSSKTYILGIISSYGKALNLDTDRLAAFFRREYERQEDIRFKRKVKKHYLVPQTQKIFRLVIAIIFIIVISYFGYQLKIYFSPPHIEIIEPKKTVFRKIDKIDLIGKTEKEAIVNINGERVFLDKNNIFKLSLPLSKSKNEVVIEVTGANGRKTIVKKAFEKVK